MLKESTAWVLAYAKSRRPVDKEEVDSVGHTGLFTSIAVDSTGNPHISYYDFDQKNLRYAKRVGNGWTKETIDSPGDVGQCTSIAVGADGSPHRLLRRIQQEPKVCSVAKRLDEDDRRFAG